MPSLTKTRWIALLVIALTLLPNPFQLAGSASAETRGAVAVVAHLPSPRSAVAAAWTGQDALLFGGGRGTNVQFADILRYDPITHGLTSLGDLPSPRSFAAAAWDGHEALVVGGFQQGHGLTDILQVAQGQVWRASASLPQPTWGANLLWAHGAAYVFGGWTNGGATEAVYRYHPGPDTLERLPVNLVQARAFAALAWDGGDNVWLFGGRDRFFHFMDSIDHVSLKSLTVDREATTLPVADAGYTAAWNGTRALLFFGQGAKSTWDTKPTLAAFDPGAHTVVPIVGGLVVPRGETSSIWDGRALHVFGGNDVSKNFTDEVLQVEFAKAPENHAPVAVVAPVPVAECEGGGSVVQLDGSASSDPDGDRLTYTWEWNGVRFDDPTNARPTAVFPLGHTRVSLIVSDGRLHSRAVTDVEVRDTQPPVLRLMRPARGTVYLDDAPMPVPSPPAPLPDTVALGRLTLQAEATDACGIAGVRFQSVLAAPPGITNYFLDETDTQAPYNAVSDPPFAGQSGTERVEVTATDLAGHSVGAPAAFFHGTRGTFPTLPPAPGVPPLSEEGLRPGLVGAHIPSAWLSVSSPLPPQQVLQVARDSRLPLVSLGVPLGSAKDRATAPARLDAWLSALAPTPVIVQSNTFALPHSAQDEAGLRRVLGSIAAVVAHHPNVVLFAGANEPFTRVHTLATPGEAVVRVKLEDRLWHELSSIPICHKMTHPAVDMPGTTWADLETLWSDSEDAVCYDWYPSPRDTPETLDALRAEGARVGKPVHILEAAMPGATPEQLREAARGMTSFVLYPLLARAGSADAPLAAWLLKDSGLQQDRILQPTPTADLLRGSEVPPSGALPVLLPGPDL